MPSLIVPSCLSFAHTGEMQLNERDGEAEGDDEESNGGDENGSSNGNSNGNGNGMDENGDGPKLTGPGRGKRKATTSMKGNSDHQDKKAK